jgi:Mg2+-importing ATPase
MQEAARAAARARHANGTVMTFRVFGLPVRVRAAATHSRRPAAPGVPLAEYAALTEAALLERLHTDERGLTNHEAALRYREAGPNSIAEGRPPPAWRQFLQYAASPLSLLLLVLAAVSYITGSTEGAAVIVAIVLLASLFSFLQEHRSSRAAEALRALVHTRVKLLRRPRSEGGEAAGNGHRVTVPLAHIVPGDVVLLAAGSLVPADVRILTAKDLFVGEAVLTGESQPVEKRPGVATAGDVHEMPNLAFMGSHVVSGTASAVVLATGARTRVGALARATRAARPPTAFERGVGGYIRLILRFMLVMVPVVFLINGYAKGDWLEAFLFALAVAVGLTPEMLPMVITANLAQGALAMARKRVIVKRLAAIQDFGAMDVLATDKTGTLTQNRVLLERHVDIFGTESLRVLEHACLNSVFQTAPPNLLDEAVLTHAELHEHIKSGAGFRKIDEIPFDFDRRRMSVVVAPNDGTMHLLICKGAVDEVLAACTRVERNGTAIPVEPGHEEELRTVTRELNRDGFRVIAVAVRALPAGPATYTVADERDLTLLGYIAFIDPPKETAARALALLRESGVAVKVLTGDNEAVARHVCGQVDALSDEALVSRADEATLFARLNPQQKARVIRALQAAGHVVGYLGDGINDGPALRAADVGVSVDEAVDIARETADIILLEHSLLVLYEGVIEGRRVFGNVTKYLRMTGSASFGNVLSVVGASALLPFLPMAPVQILLNNLLFDMAQTALATDNVDADFLAQPRRWDIRGVGRYMLCLGPVSSVFDYATFGVLAFAFDALADAKLFQTGWFVESLLSQTLVVHVIRTARIAFLESRPSRTLLATTLAVCAVGAWLPFSPFASALGLVALPAPYWWALAAILAGYLALTQAVKAWVVRRFALG